GCLSDELDGGGRWGRLGRQPRRDCGAAGDEANEVEPAHPGDGAVGAGHEAVDERDRPAAVGEAVDLAPDGRASLRSGYPDAREAESGDGYEQVGRDGAQAHPGRAVA